MRVGILGCGHLGRHLSVRVQEDPDLELCFVWSRGGARGVPGAPELPDLAQLGAWAPDLVVEVAHPDLVRAHAEHILDHADLMVGSPAALSDASLLRRVSCAAHALYVPSGAFWGAEDVRKMDEDGRLRSLSVTMRKHPQSLGRVRGPLRDLLAQVRDQPLTLYQGPVGGVCGLAPANVNTMAAAALAAPSLGFERVTGCLVADPRLEGHHVVEVEALGFPREDGTCFAVRTERRNPARPGELTGHATFDAFFRSLKRARGKGPGIHLC